jgi:hypothetical protein
MKAARQTLEYSASNASISTIALGHCRNALGQDTIDYQLARGALGLEVHLMATLTIGTWAIATQPAAAADVSALPARAAAADKGGDPAATNFLCFPASTTSADGWILPSRASAP